MLRWIAPRLFVASLCAVLLAGCGTTARKQGLAEIEALGIFSGEVRHEHPAGSLVLVALVDSARGAMAAYSVADPTGRFDVVAKPGTYELIAYVDLDGDFQWDEGEPWAKSVNPAVDTSADKGEASRNAITIPMSSDDAPGMNVDLAAQELPTADEIRAAALGRVVQADDPMLAPEAGLQSLWRPVEFLKAKGAGVFVLEPFDTKKIPVVFINGIGGSPSELMTIAKRLDGERFQPVFITYPSGLSIELNGWWLYRLAVEIRARNPEAGQSIYVAHSMGGLVARSMINRIVAAGGPRPLAFVSISTPWGGHAASNERASRIAGVPVWADLVPGSSFLSTLYETPLPDDVHYYLLFGYSGESAMVRGSDDGTVTIPSMLRYEAQDQSRKTFGFAESHTSILESEKAIATVLAILDEEAKRVGADASSGNGDSK